MRTFLLGIGATVLAGLAAACSSNTSTGSASADNGGSSSSGADSATPPSGGGAMGTAGGSSGGTPAASSSGGSSSGGAGILTAGMWDDRQNYDFFGSYLDVRQSVVAGDPGFARADYDAAHVEFGQRAPHTVVDAALVLDTTGSMGDEITYLTSEFANISAAVSAKFPGADQRWALVLYRDTPDNDPGDAYVVRSFDFTGNAQSFATTIGQQSAGGGGDYPESPHLGIAELSRLSWRPGPDVAKLAFWIGDAPHHEQDAPAMKQAIAGAHGAGIHLYPVSASGTDDLLELTMRSAAELTGGRYLFLTDDSGVGGPHKEPEIPCYFVTKLSKAVVRSVAMELSGTNVALDPNDILRTAGSPTMEGKCTTGGGKTVQIL
jgi:hypothetical protein